MGGALHVSEINNTRFKSIQPLKLKGKPFDNDWMGLSWIIPHEHTFLGQGIYKILDLEKRQVTYIGQSTNLEKRLKTHRRKNWRVEKNSTRVVELPSSTLPHQRLELENDLLGAYYSLYQDLPPS